MPTAIAVKNVRDKIVRYERRSRRRAVVRGPETTCGGDDAPALNQPTSGSNDPEEVDTIRLAELTQSVKKNKS